ncbi:ABC transporter substrate-binding protein [Williamsia sterculiae]|nr:ABC transporter substrate-binding protein [Williamsia sterculiae]
MTTVVLVFATACGGSDESDTQKPVDLNADPAACANSDKVAPPARADRSFEFTDGRGKTVKLDKQPTRIIADEESAAALYAAGIKPVGIWSTTPLSVSPILKCLDLDGVQAVGEKWGDISMEKVLALKPDLFVGEYNPRFKQFGKLTSASDSSKADRLDQIAPTLGVTLDTTSTTATIENYQKLDTALGVNENSDDQKRIKADFDTAVERFKKVAAERQDVTGMGVWPLEVAYVLDPKADPDFSDYTRWGLKMFTPDRTDDGYWRKYSWETFPPKAADLAFVYHDVANSANVKLADVGQKFPVFQQSAAVNAKQMVLWDYGANKSYPRYTKTINAFADALEKSKKVT